MAQPSERLRAFVLFTTFLQVHTFISISFIDSRRFIDLQTRQIAQMTSRLRDTDTLSIPAI